MKALIRVGPASELAARLSLLEVESSFAAGVPIAPKTRSHRPNDPAYEGVSRRIRAALDTHLLGRIRQLRVSATEHFVILTGSCSSYYTKQLAQHVAMEHLQGRRLINNIVVSSPK